MSRKPLRCLRYRSLPGVHQTNGDCRDGSQIIAFVTVGVLPLSKKCLLAVCSSILLSHCWEQKRPLQGSFVASAEAESGPLENSPRDSLGHKWLHHMSLRLLSSTTFREYDYPCTDLPVTCATAAPLNNSSSSALLIDLLSYAGMTLSRA